MTDCVKMGDKKSQNETNINLRISHITDHRQRHRSTKRTSALTESIQHFTIKPRPIGFNILQDSFTDFRRYVRILKN